MNAQSSRILDLDGTGFTRELERNHPHLISQVVFLTGDVLSPEAHGLRYYQSVTLRPIERVVAELRNREAATPPASLPFP